jgi:hypothetical protein
LVLRFSDTFICKNQLRGQVMKSWIGILAAMMISGTAHAQSIGTYSFDGSAGNETTLPADAQPDDATLSVMSRGAGVNPSTAGGAFSANGWSTGALDTTDYFEFTLTPDSGFAATLTSLVFDERRSGTGPRDIAVRSSLDSFATDIITFNVPDNTSTREQTVSLGSSFEDLEGDTTFRIYGYNAEGGTGTWRIDNVVLSGTIESSGPPPPPSTNVQFSASSASVGEDVGTYDITLIKTVDSGNVSGEIGISGTAVNGDDFTINATNFTMNGATTSTVFTVTVIDDEDEEAPHTVVLTIQNVTGGGIGSLATFTLTINDNDGTPPPADTIVIDFEGASETKTAYGSGTVNLSGLDWDMTEALVGTLPADFKNGARSARMRGYGTSAMTLLDDLTNGLASISFEYRRYGTDAQVDWRVEYTTDGVIWNQVGSDFTAPATDDVQTFDEDVNVSGDVRVRIKRATETGASNNRLNVDDITLVPFGGPPPAPGTNVQFTASAATVEEDVGTYEITLVKTLDSGNVSGEIGISGTAVNGDDFTINATNFTMNGTTTSTVFTVTVIDDEDEESPHTVILTLQNVTGGEIGSPSTFTLTIEDNDAAPEPGEGILAYRFTSTPFLEVTTQESGISVSEMALTSGTIETNISTGDYFPNEPYIEETAGWTATNQASAKAFEFTITPDVDASVTITGISFRVYATPAGPSAIGYDIGGLDSAEFNLTNAVLLEVNEPVANVVGETDPILVKIQGWLNDTRSSTGGGVLRLDDVVLYGTTGPGAPPATNVQFTASAASVPEDIGTYEITVIKTVDSGDVSGEIALSGSATQVDDYTISSTNFTMNGATTSAVFTVTVVNDTDEELDETVVLTIVNVVGGDIASPSEFTLTIEANDEPLPPPGNIVIDFEGASEVKGSYASETVNLSGLDWDMTEALIGSTVSDWFNDARSARMRGYDASAMTLLDPLTNGLGSISFDYRRYFTDPQVSWVVEYTTNDTDWVQIGSPFTAPASDDVQSFDEAVNIENDVRIRIKRETASGDANQRVNIDDIVLTPYSAPSATDTNVQFTAASDVVDEDAGTYEVTLIKTVDSGNVSGEIALSGTATVVDDYTISSTNFTLNGATTSTVFTVTIVDDEAVDTNETVVLTIVNVIGADEGTPSVFTLTITDNDVVEEADIEAFMFVGSTPGATFPSQAGVEYFFEYTTNLLANPVIWIEADSATGDGNDISLSDADPADPTRIYRIMAE